MINQNVLFLFIAPLDVMIELIEPHTINNYEKTLVQRKEIMHNTETVEPLLRDEANVEIDTRKPLKQVVNELEQIANINN